MCKRKPCELHCVLKEPMNGLHIDLLMSLAPNLIIFPTPVLLDLRLKTISVIFVVAWKKLNGIFSDLELSSHS